MNPKIKNILIAVGALVVLVAGYLIFFNKPEIAPLATTTGSLPSTSGTAVSGNTEVQTDFLETLLNIRNIKLDDSTFNSPAFNNLRDYTITLVPEGNEGRPNPFAPIGLDQASSGLSIDDFQQFVPESIPTENTSTIPGENTTTTTPENSIPDNSLLENLIQGNSVQ